MLERIASNLAVLAFICGAGASFAFGAVAMCRLMKWAPVSITVTVNHPLVDATSADHTRTLQ